MPLLEICCLTAASVRHIFLFYCFSSAKFSSDMKQSLTHRLELLDRTLPAARYADTFISCNTFVYYNLYLCFSIKF